MQIRRNITKTDVSELVKRIPRPVLEAVPNPYGLNLDYVSMPVNYGTYTDEEKSTFLMARWTAKMNNMLRLDELGFTLRVSYDGEKNQWLSPEGTLCQPLPPDEALPE